VDMLHSIAQSSNNGFKACVSSQLWKAYEGAFANIPQLKLQDLTRSNICQFVHDSLVSDAEVCEILKADEKLAEKLKSEVTENADGVFLWVVLAVRTLVERCTSTDTVAGLIQKLSTLPKDLDNLFRHPLFEAKTTAELEKQSRILQIIRAGTLYATLPP